MYIDTNSLSYKNAVQNILAKVRDGYGSEDVEITINGNIIVFDDFALSCEVLQISNINDQGSVMSPERNNFGITSADIIPLGFPAFAFEQITGLEDDDLVETEEDLGLSDY